MLSPEEKTKRKNARILARKTAKENARVLALKSQKPVSNLTISIEWRKSRIWGHNPHARAEVRFHDGTYQSVDGFTCSGCGYDKESTVIAEIFNMFLTYKLYQPIKKIGTRYDNETQKSIPCLPYGISIHKAKKGENIHGEPIPAYEHRRFEGGVGTSCYGDISRAIGGSFVHTASGKSFDVYTYTDRRKK